MFGGRDKRGVDDNSRTGSTILGLSRDPFPNMSSYHPLDVQSLGLGGGARVDEMNGVLFAPLSAFFGGHVRLAAHASARRQNETIELGAGKLDAKSSILRSAQTGGVDVR